MKKTTFIQLLFCLFSYMAVAQDAEEKRVALVIGNADYEGSAKLKNPKHDADKMREVLTEVGFKVIYAENADFKEMRKKISEFKTELLTHNVALFYYAGHGIQIADANYLIPIGANLEELSRDESYIKQDCHSVSEVLEAMSEKKSNLNIVILDACRNNPLPSKSRSIAASRQGLAALSASAGTIVMYATKAGQTASDGDGENGLFTSALITNIRKREVKIEDCFKEVGRTVYEKSGSLQNPELSSQYYGTFYFKPKGKFLNEEDKKLMALEAQEEEARKNQVLESEKLRIEAQVALERKRIEGEVERVKNAEKQKFEELKRKEEQAQLAAKKVREEMQKENEKREKELKDSKRKEEEAQKELRKLQKELEQQKEKLNKEQVAEKQRVVDSISRETDRFRNLEKELTAARQKQKQDSIALYEKADALAKELALEKLKTGDDARNRLADLEKESQASEEKYKNMLNDVSKENLKLREKLDSLENAAKNAPPVKEIQNANTPAKPRKLTPIELTQAQQAEINERRELEWLEKGEYVVDFDTEHRYQYKIIRDNDLNYQVDVFRIVPSTSDIADRDLVYYAKMPVIEKNDKILKIQLYYSFYNPNAYVWKTSPSSYVEAIFDLETKEVTYTPTGKAVSYRKSSEASANKATFQDANLSTRAALSQLIEFFISNYSAAMK